MKVYEVWCKMWSDKEKECIMKKRGEFTRVSDAEIFARAYEDAYLTMPVIVATEKF